MKSTSVTVLQLQVFGEVPITHHISIPEALNQLNQADYIYIQEAMENFVFPDNL